MKNAKNARNKCTRVAPIEPRHSINILFLQNSIFEHSHVPADSLNIVAFLGLLLSEIARQYGRFAIAKPIGGVVCFILLRIQRPLLSDLYKSLAMPYIC